MNTLAVMQPYFFPYIGYFQLIGAVKEFVFYDDVQYIKSGWINRNRILINGSPNYITIPCNNASPNRMINEVEFALDPRTKKKLLNKIAITYKKAPFFDSVNQLIIETLDTEGGLISNLAIKSIIKCSDYLDIDTTFVKSSEKFSNKELDAAPRLIDMCKQENALEYINPIGGKDLYNKDYFSNNGVELRFLETRLDGYVQFGHEFIPGLSIIDVLMFNSPQKIKEEFLANPKLC